MKRAVGLSVYLCRSCSKSYPGEPKHAASADRRTDDLRASWHVVFNDRDVVRHGVRSARAGDGCSALQSYALREKDTCHPGKRSRGDRDRVAVRSLKIVDVLYVY